MSEVRVIKVKSCKECPYMGRSVTHKLPFCWKTQKYLEGETSKIPDWCPLEKEK